MGTLVNFVPSEETPASHLNSANGNSVAVDHEGNLVAVGNGAEGVTLAKFDIRALREYRASQRGRALMSPKQHPEICQLWKPQNTSSGQMWAAADHGPWGRINAPF